ncbi:MAG: hypothetical protein AB8F26_11775 [Phycisphaerales bacterium]
MLLVRFGRLALAALFLLLTTPVDAAAPQGTGFTYQGHLADGGSPANGTVSITFRMFDSETGGLQVGTDIVRSVTPVDGVFSESLDFGAGAWADNQARWLEIEVEGELLGRQAIESTPFSLNTRGITVTADNRVGFGTEAPTFPLELHANARGFAHIDPASGVNLGTYANSFGGWIGTYSDSPLFFFTNDSAPLMAIDTDGQVSVGLGFTSALARLHVRDFDMDGTGVLVDQSGPGITFGVDATVGSGFGVRGTATETLGSNYGVYGEAQGANSWGVFSNGRIGATGTKSFAIDHPLNPEEWVLLHYSSEAPEPLNTYSGTVVLDATGSAVVTLPDYYASINTDERYQLTPIGAPAPNLYIASKVDGNVFAIAGGPPGIEVSWQVTAKRNDRFVKQRGAPIEIRKTGPMRGKYLVPKLFDSDEQIGGGR